MTLLIDKLCLIAPVYVSRRTIERYNEKLVQMLSTNFDGNYYKVEKNYNWLIIRLIPTRYEKAKHNIETIKEHELYSILVKIQEICPNLDFHILEIHLAKDKFMNETVDKYMNCLIATNCRNVRPIIYEKTYESQTEEGEIKYIRKQHIQLAPLKNDNKDKEITGKHIIKFYDKTLQLEEEKGVNIHNLELRHELPEEEINSLPNPSMYNRENNSIDASETIMLRCEISYKGTHFMSKLIPQEKKDKESKFMLNTFIDLLQQGKCYEHLETIYKERLKETIFYDEEEDNSSSITLNSKLKSINLAKYGLSTYRYYLKNFFSFLGIGENDNIIKSLSCGVRQSEEFLELKEKFLS